MAHDLREDAEMIRYFMEDLEEEERFYAVVNLVHNRKFLKYGICYTAEGLGIDDLVAYAREEIRKDPAWWDDYEGIDRETESHLWVLGAMSRIQCIYEEEL